ncbi:MAG: hypothetical protein OXB98_15160 [Bryobacterales bacterium]|nr:hypothetical protein [Bryobacterales bacterium]
MAAAAERFSLYTGCSPLSLEVGFMKMKVVGMDALTATAVRRATRGRLSEAGLYAPSSPHQVYAGVGMNGSSLSVYVHFRKQLHDPLSGQNGRAVTWSRLSGGRNAGGAPHALAVLGNHLDAFLNDYRRINKDACGKA